MMTYSEEQIALAAEYALGTLDADERVQVEVLMFADPAFRSVVEAWSRKLGALNEMVGLAEPSPAVWDRIKAAIARDLLEDLPQLAPAGAGPGVFVAPEAPLPASAAPRVAVDDSEPTNVIAWRGAVRRWRSTATAMTAIAAGLAAVVAVQAYRPDMLPKALRPPQKVEVVEIPGPPQMAPAQYVALLQTDASSPAFILSVDAAAKTFMVRKVGATLPPGKSYELWLVSDKLKSPASLGLIGDTDFTPGPQMTRYDRDMVSNATYAVTLEPEGGAPGGVATGPIVFTGKLIETMPPAPMPAAPTLPAPK